VIIEFVEFVVIIEFVEFVVFIEFVGLMTIAGARRTAQGKGKGIRKKV